jgi:hypothetical protein
MEARTLAKVNQVKSDQIKQDIETFVKNGGKIQVIEHKSEQERLDSVKKATASPEVEAELDEEVEDEIAEPSTTTPEENLETPIE